MITTLPTDANAVAVISSDKDFDLWLYNSFIQLYQKNSSCAITYFDFNYRSAPMLVVKKTDKNLFDLKDFNCFSEFIKNSLRHNNYIYLMVNKKYIPLYRRQNDTYHDMFVYGYDDNKKIFFIADCFEGGKYTFNTCTFDELYLAVSNVSEEKENYLGFKKCIELISCEKIKSNLFIDRIRTSIRDYVESTPTTFWFIQEQNWHNNVKDRKFGLDCYDALINILENISVGDVRARFIIISIEVMIEHKNIMINRLTILGKIYKIDIEKYITSYSEIKNNVLKCRSLFLKYGITKSETHINAIIQLYEKVRRYEKILLLEILKTLQPLPQLTRDEIMNILF